MKLGDPSRRGFLKTVVGVAATSAASDYWEMVRRQFPFDERRVPLNAGNLCPSPRAVSERVAALTADIDRDVSYTNRAKLAATLERSREKVAQHLRADAEEIALVRNTSEANATVIGGLHLSSGDEVVLWSENHPTNNVAWDVRAARDGFALHRVELSSDATGDEIVARFVEALTSRVRVLAVSHLSNYSGVLLPVEALVREAHARGIFVLVDGAQTWGALDVDVGRLGCDAFTASTHKWLCGPKEAGVLYVRHERIDDIDPHTVAFGWSQEHASGAMGARKFETLGQRDDACLAGITPAVDFHLAIGRARVESRMRELATKLKEGLRERGVALETPMSAELSAGVCTVTIPRNQRRAVVFELDKRGIAGSPAGGLRLCPHVYNTMEHIERAVEAVSDVVEDVTA